MRIAIVTDGIFPHSIGGIQRHSLNLIKHLAEYSEVSLHVLHPHKKFLFQEFSNITEYQIQDIESSKLYLLECKAYSKRVAEVLSGIEIDVVYAQGISVWEDIDVFKDKLIVNPHGIEAFQARTFMDKLKAIPFKRVQSKIFKKARFVISEGGHLTPYLERASGDKSKVVYLPNATDKGVQETEITQYNDEITRCLFVARFASNKGIYVLLDAVKTLNKNHNGLKKYEFNLAGKGPLFDEIYDEHKNIENVNFLGFVSDEDLESLYQTSHVFMFPTLFEGMPTAIIEAMSYGLPVIASDTGAIPELVDESNGALVVPGNTSDLTEALVKFEALPEATKVSKANHSKAKVNHHFNWTKVAADHMKLFKQI